MDINKKTLGYCKQCMTMQLFPVSGISLDGCPICSKKYIPAKEKKCEKKKEDNKQQSLFNS